MIQFFGHWSWTRHINFQNHFRCDMKMREKMKTFPYLKYINLSVCKMINRLKSILNDCENKKRRRMLVLTQCEIKVCMHARGFIRQWMHSALRTTNHLVRNVQSDGILHICALLYKRFQMTTNKWSEREQSYLLHWWLSLTTCCFTLILCDAPVRNSHFFHSARSLEMCACGLMMHVFMYVGTHMKSNIYALCSFLCSAVR